MTDSGTKCAWVIHESKAVQIHVYHSNRRCLYVPRVPGSVKNPHNNNNNNNNNSYKGPASVAQLDAPSDWRPGGRGFNPRRGRQHSFVESDHEIFSTAILSLPLIQEGQLSVSGERMCTILVNRLED